VGTTSVPSRQLNMSLETGSAFMPAHPNPIFLVGPTAVGKSEVALLLAEELKAEIVSADSMQVYRGMDIGTAKPTPEERARVPHHLIDVVEVGEPFDVARYRELAVAAIAEIQQRRRLPLVVGGSGMYLRALSEGLFAGPSADPKRRAALESQPAEQLFARLREVDPVSAARIPMGNKRRLVRALEVFEVTGKPLSTQQKQWSNEQRSTMILLERDRAELYARIEQRVDWMFDNGLIEETQRLLAQGLAQNSVARVAAGYKETMEHLHGARDLAQTKHLVKQRTRQLAKRQLTWFRHQAKVISVEAGQTAAETKERVRPLIEDARS
jgi:tRNA dimethylallyltransferase